MNGSTSPGERGFTLIELAIAVAVLGAAVAAGVGLSLSSRSLAVATASTEFDHMLESVRTVARQTGGATIVFAPDAYADGTDVRVMTSGAANTLVPTAMPVMHTRAAIAEAERLGAAPFALVVHATGLLGGRAGFRAGDATTGPELGCPASGSFHFTITAAGAHADRFVPCRLDLAATAPVTFVSPPPTATPAMPTPCAACVPVTPPPMPPCASGLPPGPSGCSATAGAPQYHVTASAASATMAVGATDVVTAQATLTNPLSVPASTPATLPVLAHTSDAPCSISPSGPQPSGSAFSVLGVAAGICTVVVDADTSAVPSASADEATVAVPFGASPQPTSTPTPGPQSCDLVTDGKCFRQVLPRTTYEFTKAVIPDVDCDNGPPTTCRYADRVKVVTIGPDVRISLPAPPVDADRELLVVVNRLNDVIDGCLPFSAISSYENADGNIPWPQTGIGSPLDAPDGFGQPSVFINVLHIGDDLQALQPVSPWTFTTHFKDLYRSVADRDIGTALRTLWYGSQATDMHIVPDFGGCDSGDDSLTQEHFYGLATLGVTLTVFQATP